LLFLLPNIREAYPLIPFGAGRRKGCIVVNVITVAGNTVHKTSIPQAFVALLVSHFASVLQVSTDRFRVPSSLVDREFQCLFGTTKSSGIGAP
jgi:hypothetical protein